MVNITTGRVVGVVEKDTNNQDYSVTIVQVVQSIRNPLRFYFGRPEYLGMIYSLEHFTFLLFFFVVVVMVLVLMHGIFCGINILYVKGPSVNSLCVA